MTDIDSCSGWRTCYNESITVFYYSCVGYIEFLSIQHCIIIYRGVITLPTKHLLLWFHYCMNIISTRQG